MAGLRLVMREVAREGNDGLGFYLTNVVAGFRV